MAITPLSTHGGACPPLVAGPGSRLTVTVRAGHGAARCEVDGQRTPIDGQVLMIDHRADYATLVALDGDEPRLTGLRRRGLVLDSARVVVRQTRETRDCR
jgi:hypothetical protein